MKLFELYALTITGLRRWPNPKTGAEHSSQEVIVTKDPIKHPIVPSRPKKPVPFFQGGLGPKKKKAKTFRSKWNPYVDAAWGAGQTAPTTSPAAVSEGVQQASNGDIVARINPISTDPHDIAEIVAELVTYMAESYVLEKEKQHNKIYIDDDDPKFEHNSDVYFETAEELLDNVKERLDDITSTRLRDIVEMIYDKLPDVVKKNERRKRQEELK